MSCVRFLDKPGLFWKTLFLRNNRSGRVLLEARASAPLDRNGMPNSRVKDEQTALSHGERARYHRQLIMPEIGEEGQKKLKAARVCVVGIGGLGSTSAMTLASTGIGYLRLVDKDIVETSNLNRQVIHWTPDLGRDKSASAGEKLSALNPEIRIHAVRMEVTDRNVVEAVGECGLIVDATDNLAVRRVLNRFSVERGIPFIFGGVEGFQGMVTTMVPGRTPCLECLFPAGEDPPQKEIGVPGPMPGLVASIQAVEAVKLLLGVGTCLLGRLLLVRGLDMSMREVAVGRNPRCTVCSAVRRKQ